MFATLHSRAAYRTDVAGSPPEQAGPGSVDVHTRVEQVQDGPHDTSSPINAPLHHVEQEHEYASLDELHASLNRFHECHSAESVANVEKEVHECREIVCGHFSTPEVQYCRTTSSLYLSKIASMFRQ
ncbi:unnamed protein product [Amoebophrya sp. A25]|nr:unnamed protein product [Amoebophrya sp. A25]|eukprot:GSA25T00016889001.1